MKALEIGITICLFLVSFIFFKIAFKMRGKKAQDEMFLFFLSKAFRNVGFVLFIVSGLSVIVSYSQMIIFNEHAPIEETRHIFVNDLKYFLIGIAVYAYSYISFRKELRKVDKNSEGEEEQ